MTLTNCYVCILLNDETTEDTDVEKTIGNECWRSTVKRLCSALLGRGTNEFGRDY